MLAYLAAQVRDMKLISGVNLLPLHKPMDIAEQYAAIDVMSGGNFIFGTGIGYREVEFKGHGSPMAERGRRFEENLEAVRRLWTEDSVDMVGSHFELDGATCPPQTAAKTIAAVLDRRQCRCCDQTCRANVGCLDYQPS